MGSCLPCVLEKCRTTGQKSQGSVNERDEKYLRHLHIHACVVHDGASRRRDCDGCV